MSELYVVVVDDNDDEIANKLSANYTFYGCFNQPFPTRDGCRIRIKM